MLQPSTIKYYSIYFPGLPAESAYDTAFFSTDKKELEKEYTTYLVEEHLGYLIDQYNKLCQSANNPTAMITADDADALHVFAQRLRDADPAEVFTLDRSYVKKIDYPHFHIPIVDQNSETIELGQFVIKYGHEIDAVLTLNKPKLTSEDEQIINEFLKNKNYDQIDWKIHNPRKTFMVPAIWQVWGRIPVEATDIDDLKAKLKDPEFIANLTAPQDYDHYIEDSFEVDWEGDAIDELGVAYELTAKPAPTQVSPDETDNIDTIKYFSLFDLASILLDKLQAGPGITEYKCRAHWLGDPDNTPELYVKLEKSGKNSKQTVNLYIDSELASSEKDSTITMHTFFKLFDHTTLGQTKTDN